MGARGMAGSYQGALDDAFLATNSRDEVANRLGQRFQRRLGAKWIVDQRHVEPGIEEGRSDEVELGFVAGLPIAGMKIGEGRLGPRCSKKIEALPGMVAVGHIERGPQRFRLGAPPL